VKGDAAAILNQHGIQPSAQRVAVARYVINADGHPTADQVLAGVTRTFPHISRATVYNTLHLFVEKGLLREFSLVGGRVVFDPNLDRHHHFIDEKTGAIHDIPWGDLRVSNVERLQGYEVSDYQVVLRGRSKTNTGKN
jgi:Fur family iron response transcriptional regulator